MRILQINRPRHRTPIASTILFGAVCIYGSVLTPPLTGQEPPSFSVDGDKLVFDESINTDQVYEMAFEGNDAEAEIIEKSTGLTFLGNSTNTYSEPKNCVISGKSTRNRVYLARTY